MKLLAIDTTTDIASIAVSNGEAIFSEEQLGARQHAKVILPLIQQQLSKANMTLYDLDGIVWGAGPGSFTGIRIACSIAKGLAYVIQRPLYTVNSLLCIAYDGFKQAPNEHDMRIVAMLDARMQQIYWADFPVSFFHNKTVLSMPDFHVSNPGDLKLEHDAPCMIAGGYDDVIYASLPQGLRDRVVTRLNVFPHATTMIEWVLEGRVTSDTASNVVPYYVRNQVTQGAPHG